jgi:IrrE N-terminal-like domain
MLAVAETLVAAFWEGLGLRADASPPPVDVYALADRMGATIALCPELRSDGRLEESAQATRILLHTRGSEERRRFTLAHELGHLVLLEPEVLHRTHTLLNQHRVNVERLCDAFAAELLMPRRWVTAEFPDRSERFECIDLLATRTRVSISAALTRLVVVLRWRSSLIYFQRTRHWAPLVVAGARVPRGGLAPTSETARTLAAAAHDSTSHVEKLTVIYRGKQVPLSGYLRPSRGGALFLTTFPSEFGR